MDLPGRARNDESLSWYRGLPLAALDDDVREAAAECRIFAIGPDVDQALRVWDEATDASGAVEPADSWCHGDPLVENLLLEDSDGLAAVIDVGLEVGKPTVDLVVAWEALDEGARRTLRRALDIDDATWTVPRGWALLVAMVTFPYHGASMPALR